MANNYEKLVRCTQNQLEVFIDSLVNKPASHYVDWAKWLSSEDPDAPYIGTPAFYKDEDGEEKNCMLLEETTEQGEKHRKFYEVLPKGEVKELTLPAHLVRLETEEEYPEIDPIRLMVDNAMNEYTQQQDFSLLHNKPIEHEEIELTLEPQEELVQPEIKEEVETVSTGDGEFVEFMEDIEEEAIKNYEATKETPIVEEETEREIVVEEEPVLEVQETIEETQTIPEPVEEVIEETPAVVEEVVEETQPIEEVVVEETQQVEVPVVTVEETQPIEEIVEVKEEPEIAVEEIIEEPEVVVEEEIQFPKDPEIVEEVVTETGPIVKLEETASIDVQEEIEEPIESTQEIEVVVEETTQPIETVTTEDDDFDFTLGDVADDLDKELAKFEDTLSQINAVVQRDETDFTPEDTTNSIVLETEEETDVPINDLLNDIKISSGFYNPEDPEDRELPTIAFTAMNRDDD